MAFDANGNLASTTDPAGATTFAWDARNRLAGLTGPNGIASFTYDPLGRRRAKTINGQLTQYLYDGHDVLQELAAAAPVNYLRGLNIDEALVRGGGELYLADALGSTVALTDPSGAPATQYSYAPFGQTNTTGGISTNPFAFTSRERDLPDLYYYRARYYTPQLGRFISEDPLRPLNPYLYVGNNPILATDPLGLRTAVISGGPGTSGPGPGGLGLVGQSMRALAGMVERAGEPVLVFSSNQQDLAFAWLRAGAANGEPANIVCHSLGCGNTLGRLREATAPTINRLVSIDCAASAACGSVPDNVDFNLNIYQTQGLLHGQANIRTGGSMAGITNVDVTAGTNRVHR
jgi:RHS repeat-associated protein